MGRNSSGTGGRAYCVQCPFWVAYGNPATDARSVYCEGEVPDTQTKMIFKGKTQLDQHRMIYCENQYKRCEHYISVMHHRWKDDDQ